MTSIKKENICSVDEAAFHLLADHCCGNCKFYAVYYISHTTVCDREEEIKVKYSDICKFYKKSKIDIRNKEEKPVRNFSLRFGH